MSSQKVFGGSGGSLYLATDDGDLLWFGDAHRDGTPGWAANSGNRIGSGWQDCRIAFGGSDGIIYAVMNNGDLRWYRDAHRDGTPGWAANSGNRIGSGWQDCRIAFGGSDGIIYAVMNNGDLRWYRDAHRDGTPGWAANSGNRIGSGWQDCRIAFGGSDGIIYAVMNDGELRWYRDLHRDGTAGWASNSGKQIGSGWQASPYVFGEDGVFYGVDSSGILRWYRDLHRDGTAGWAARTGDAIGSGWLGAEWSPTLAAFGHGTIVQQGKPALGPRRLAVVLVEYDNDADDNFTPFSAVHPAEYYEKLAFGQQSPPFSTSNPVNPASLDGYFRECSANRFWIERTAVVGPIRMGPLTNGGNPQERARQIITKAGEVNPRIFTDSDLNGDGTVASSEMLLLIIENFKPLQPANRDNTPLQVTWQGAAKTVNLHVAFDGPLTPFYQIAHELSHSIGTIDMYNSGAGNSLLTLMGGYSFTGNDQVPVHLDAWHKLALGWCEPRRRRVTRPGEDVIVEVTANRPTGPLILWHPARATSEYFIVERRSSNGTNRAYDSGFPGDGAVIWRVTPAGLAPTALGAPNLAVGGNGVWGSGQTTPPLPWSDGTSSGVRLTFHSSPDFTVSWA